jgi:predicted  nucleic acid-binding Zn-ribbon protein
MRTSWVGVALAVLVAAAWQPAVAGPERPPVAAAKARAEALRRQVNELTARTERLAAAVDAEQARVDALVVEATLRERQLDEAERALAEAGAGYRDEVRDLYAQGPLAPFELLLASGDPAALALATRVAAASIQQRRGALGEAQTARDRVDLALAELRHGQEGVRASTRRLESRRDALAAELAAVQALLDQADAQVRRALEAERARRLAAHRAAVEAAGLGGRVGRGLRCDLSGASPAELFIISHESGGDPTAANPGSTAFGLGQLLLDMRLRYLGVDYATTDCGRQLGAFRAYVRDRYGTAERAMAFWVAHHWY